jgi:hypothetical protein
MTLRDTFNTDLNGIYDEVADFFASSPSAQQITQYRLSEASERFISDLLEANRTRGLTPDEQATLDEYIRIERLVQSIKARAFAKPK